LMVGNERIEEMNAASSKRDVIIVHSVPVPDCDARMSLRTRILWLVAIQRLRCEAM